MSEKKNRFLIFLNPAAGSGRAGLFYRKIMEKMFFARGIDYVTVVTNAKGDIRKYVRNFSGSVSSGYERIIAMGGDGTSWETLSSLMENDICGIPVCIFPFGSGNDLARSLGMPVYNPTKSLEICLKGALDELDICTVNGAHFANYLTFGFDGEVIHRRAAEKIELPGYTSYVRPIMKTLENLKYHLYHLKIDGKEVDVIGIACIISNIPSQYGGVKLVTDARYNDGRFEITVIKKTLSVKTFLKFPFLHGKALSKSEYVRFKTDHALIDFDDAPPPIQIDGDPYKPFLKHFEICIKRGAIKVIKKE